MNVHDCEVIDGSVEASEEDYYISLQRAINSGSGWSMQGSMGRAMMEAIDSGHCVLGRNGAYDYYNNYIPSRTDVKEGTKGSREYVALWQSESWAERIAAI